MEPKLTLEQELARAQAKADMWARHIEDWRIMYDRHTADYREVLDMYSEELDRLRSINTRLHMALADYGRHTEACETAQQLESRPCSCGLAEAFDLR